MSFTTSVSSIKATKASARLSGLLDEFSPTDCLFYWTCITCERNIDYMLAFSVRVELKV